MKDYKQRAEKILERRDNVLAARHRRKNALFKYSVPAAALCAVIAVCFGAVMWNSSVAPDPAKIISVIRSSSSADREAVTNEAAASNESTAETTSTSVSSIDKTVTQTTLTDISEYEYEDEAEDGTSYAQPAVTEVTSVTPSPASEEKPTEVVTQPTDITDVISEPEDGYGFNYHGSLPRLAAKDDPIWVFSEINYDGIDYHGCKYLSESNKNSFYIAWFDEAEFTVSQKDREVTEPMTVYGLSDKEEFQDYIIIRFNNYNIYALYESMAEQPDEPYVPEYEDEDEEESGEQTPTESEPSQEQPIDNE